MAAALMLVACNSQPSTSNSESKAPEYDRTSLSIIAPTGAPALAFYNYAKVEKFETNSNPAEGILPLMVAGKKDVVVLPTNAGMQAIINKKAVVNLSTCHPTRWHNKRNIMYGYSFRQLYKLIIYRF